MNCNRCGNPTMVSSMSRFDTATLCMPCIEDEKLAPNYEKARLAEEEQCKQKNYNYAGIGLQPEDRLFLMERRAARVKDAKIED